MRIPRTYNFWTIICAIFSLLKIGTFKIPYYNVDFKRKCAHVCAYLSASLSDSSSSRFPEPRVVKSDEHNVCQKSTTYLHHCSYWSASVEKSRRRWKAAEKLYAFLHQLGFLSYFTSKVCFRWPALICKLIEISMRRECENAYRTDSPGSFLNILGN